MIFFKMAFKSLAKSLVRFELTGTENEVYRENAEKAMDILVSDIAESTGQRYGPYWIKYSFFVPRMAKTICLHW